MRFTNQNITSLLVLASMLFIFSCGKENDIVPVEPAEPTVKSTTNAPTTTAPTTVPTTPTPPVTPPPTTESEFLEKSF